MCSNKQNRRPSVESTSRVRYKWPRFFIPQSRHPSYAYNETLTFMPGGRSGEEEKDGGRQQVEVVFVQRIVFSSSLRHLLSPCCVRSVVLDNLVVAGPGWQMAGVGMAWHGVASSTKLTEDIKDDLTGKVYMVSMGLHCLPQLYI